MKFKQAYQIVENPQTGDGWTNPSITYRPKNGPAVRIPIAAFDDPECWAWTVDSTDEEFNSAVKSIKNNLSSADSHSCQAWGCPEDGSCINAKATGGDTDRG